ncbi:(R)-mandelonitrile lyase [Sphingobium xenophagum]
MKALLALAALVATPAWAQTAHVEVFRAGSHPAVPGPAERFTGKVTVQPVFDPHSPSTVSAGTVTFQPGAHSAWHRHPKGQYLIVLSGVGWTQEEGQPIIEIHPGDVVWCPPGVKHWHGASATTGLVQLSVQEAVDGKNVEWLEKVSAADYAKGPGVK